MDTPPFIALDPTSLTSLGNSDFGEYMQRALDSYGARFNPTGLLEAKSFMPYYGRAWRVRVIDLDDRTRYGHVSATTGWRPALLLMRDTRAMGSVTVLHDDYYTLTGVKRYGDRDYVDPRDV